MSQLGNCGAACLGHSGIRANAQTRNGAGSFIAKNQSLSVAAGCRAAILQPPAIIAGLRSAVVWSYPTAEGVPSTAEGRQHKGIYFQTDQRTDQWSDVVSVLVAANG